MQHFVPIWGSPELHRVTRLFKKYTVVLYVNTVDPFEHKLYSQIHTLSAKQPCLALETYALKTTRELIRAIAKHQGEECTEYVNKETYYMYTCFISIQT